MMVAAIRYDDVMTRTEAGWRFARRLYVDWVDTRTLGQPRSPSLGRGVSAHTIGLSPAGRPAGGHRPVRAAPVAS